MLEPADAAWLTDAFGLDTGARLVGPVDRGLQGQVWRLETGAGAYAVKETFYPLADEQAQRAHDFQVRAATHGVLSPEPVRTRDGRVLIRHLGEPIRVYHWVEMRTTDRSIDPAAVGRTLASLHRAGGTVDGEIPPWYIEPVGRASWEEVVSQLRAARAPFADRLSALVDDLVAAESVITRPEPPLTLCHLDLWADNVRATPDGGTVVIDWDNCGPASPDQELAMVLVEFGTSPGRARDLYGAYRDAGGTARIRSAAEFGMAVAFLGHLAALAARHWLEAAAEAQRANAEQRFDEFASEPLDLATIDRLLSWLRPPGTTASPGPSGSR